MPGQGVGWRRGKESVAGFPLPVSFQPLPDVLALRPVRGQLQVALERPARAVPVGQGVAGQGEVVPRLGSFLHRERVLEVRAGPGEIPIPEVRQPAQEPGREPRGVRGQGLREQGAPFREVAKAHAQVAEDPDLFRRQPLHRRQGIGQRAGVS